MVLLLLIMPLAVNSLVSITVQKCYTLCVSITIYHANIISVLIIGLSADCDLCYIQAHTIPILMQQSSYDKSFVIPVYQQLICNLDNG